jgi:hypothetical protein
MTDHRAAHMRATAVRAAEAAYEEHEASCEACRSATRATGCCEKGRELHNASVVAAQDAYRAANPAAFAPEPHDG